MRSPEPHEALIRALSGELRPVRPLRSPWLRAAGWIACVLAAAAALAAFAGPGGISGRLATPAERAAVIGAAATAVLAGIAAFLLSVPDRRPAWALLPVPSLLLWLYASGLGCLRVEQAGVEFQGAHSPRGCFTFIVCASVPLSLLLFLMLRRAYSLRPNLTATMGGLAAAAASATLLEFVHPFETGALDLLGHLAAVLVVIAANWALSGRGLHRALP